MKRSLLTAMMGYCMVGPLLRLSGTIGVKPEWKHTMEALDLTALGILALLVLINLPMFNRK